MSANSHINWTMPDIQNSGQPQQTGRQPHENSSNFMGDTMELVIRVGPATWFQGEQAALPEGNITLCIRPIHNVIINTVQPGRMEEDEGIITPFGTNWYLSGATIGATTNINSWAHTAFDVTAKASVMLTAGLTLRVWALTGEVRPFCLSFPSGTLPQADLGIRVDLAEFVRSIYIHRQPMQQLGTYVPRLPNPSIQPRDNTQRNRRVTQQPRHFTQHSRFQQNYR